MLEHTPWGLTAMMRDLVFPDGHVGSWKSLKQECGRVSVGDGRKVFRPRPGDWGGD